MNTQPQSLSRPFQPSGDIVAATVPILRSQLRVFLESGILQLVLDLSNVRMVDSIGIGLLIAAHNSLKQAGGELSMIHASKDVFDLFRTLRMHQHFSISGN